VLAGLGSEAVPAWARVPVDQVDAAARARDLERVVGEKVGEALAGLAESGQVLEAGGFGRVYVDGEGDGSSSS
jgi:hypothetical protein